MAKNAANAATDDAPKSFEAALAELEKLVAGMESGQLSLEQSLAAHKRGLELAQYCQAKLAQAQQQVQVLEANTLQAFPGAEQDDDSVAWMGAVQARMETALQRLLPAPKIVPERLHQAMHYAVLGGGQRVRPLLAFAAGE